MTFLEKLNQIEKHIDKIKVINSNLVRSNRFSILEADLVKEYLRSVYDYYLDLEKLENNIVVPEIKEEPEIEEKIIFESESVVHESVPESIEKTPIEIQDQEILADNTRTELSINEEIEMDRESEMEFKTIFESEPVVYENSKESNIEIEANLAPHEETNTEEIEIKKDIEEELKTIFDSEPVVYENSNEPSEEIEILRTKEIKEPEIEADLTPHEEINTEEVEIKKDLEEELKTIFISEPVIYKSSYEPIEELESPHPKEIIEAKTDAEPSRSEVFINEEIEFEKEPEVELKTIIDSEPVISKSSYEQLDVLEIPISVEIKESEIIPEGVQRKLFSLEEIEKIKEPLVKAKTIESEYNMSLFEKYQQTAVKQEINKRTNSMRPLKQLISFNDKFMIIKTLFNNEISKYDAMIQAIDKMQTKSEAMNYIEINVLNNKEVKNKEEIMKRVESILDLKFSIV